MLNGTLALHNVPDTEQLCARIVRGHPALKDLNPEQREDATAYLIETCWRLAQRFDTDRNNDFAGYATALLKRRVNSWLRTHLGRTRWQFAGRTHERERPTLRSLDAPTTRHHGSPRLGELLATDQGDPAIDHWAEGLTRLVNERHRARARNLDTLRQGLREHADHAA